MGRIEEILTWMFPNAFTLNVKVISWNLAIVSLLCGCGYAIDLGLPFSNYFCITN